MKNKTLLADFDEFGFYTIQRPDLLEVVMGGSLAPATTEANYHCDTLNKICNNASCVNGNCSRNANCIVIGNVGCSNDAC